MYVYVYIHIYIYSLRQARTTGDSARQTTTTARPRTTGRLSPRSLFLFPVERLTTYWPRAMGG